MEHENAPEHEDGIVYILTQLPVVGGWLCLCLMVLPAAAVALLFGVLLLLLEWLFGMNVDDPGVVLIGLTLIGVVLAVIWSFQWFYFLEDEAGIRLTFYWIPCIWILWAAIVGCVLVVLSIPIGLLMGY